MQNLIDSMVKISQNNAQKFSPQPLQLQQPEIQQSPQAEMSQLSYMPYNQMNRYGSSNSYNSYM